MSSQPKATVQKPSVRQRLCYKDDKRFKAYIQSTTTHGVVRVFTGKSKLRRIFWLVIVLLAAGGCLANIVDRIEYLVRQPTATTISQVREQSLVFPAVTICNLNVIKRSVVEMLNLEFVESYGRPELGLCDQDALNISEIPEDINYRNLIYQARHLPEDLIQQCVFAGVNCTADDFQPLLTKLGYCYTFNGGAHLTSLGTGTRHGLYLVLNIEQSEYILASGVDAGVKIAVHDQDEPAEPDEIGIAVPPGRNAFISLRKKVVKDNSESRGKRCRDGENIKGFNFLYEMYNYSTAACLIDCFYTNITEECGCIDAGVENPPLSSKFSGVGDCRTTDYCGCVQDLYFQPQVCDCPASCSYVSYEHTISYSIFPSTLEGERLALSTNSTTDYINTNLLGVNVYFETLNIQAETTVDAYSTVALLSDIGGQLGLFLGASVISVLEFGMWVMDEIKDRCCGLSDKKLQEWSEQLEEELAELEKEKDKERKVVDNQSPSETSTTIISQ